jgi:hypothetical protein
MTAIVVIGQNFSKLYVEGYFWHKFMIPFCQAHMVIMSFIDFFFHYAQTQQSTFLLPWKPQVFKNCFCPVC